MTTPDLAALRALPDPTRDGLWTEELATNIRARLRESFSAAQVALERLENEEKDMALRETESPWEATAAQEARNRDYYRGLVVEIGHLLGDVSRIADDGTRADDVLCAKVPALVKARLARLETALRHARRYVQDRWVTWSEPLALERLQQIDAALEGRDA